jgi:hypothetical protein
MVLLGLSARANAPSWSPFDGQSLHPSKRPPRGGEAAAAASDSARRWRRFISSLSEEPAACRGAQRARAAATPPDEESPPPSPPPAGTENHDFGIVAGVEGAHRGGGAQRGRSADVHQGAQLKKPRPGHANGRSATSVRCNGRSRFLRKLRPPCSGDSREVASVSVVLPSGHVARYQCWPLHALGRHECDAGSGACIGRKARENRVGFFGGPS